jgi:hypothetical protein
MGDMGERRGLLRVLRKRGGDISDVSVLASNDDVLSDPYAELGFRAPVADERVAPARVVIAA